MALHSPLGIWGEHPVDDAAVGVQLRVETRAEAMHQAHRPQTRPTGDPRARLAQGLFDHAQEDTQHRADPRRVAHQEVALALRDRQHPYMVRPAMQEGSVAASWIASRYRSSPPRWK